MKGTLAYKVVTSQRNSCILKGTKYNIKYKKGTTVRAHEKTIGIMCFNSYDRAQEFTHNRKNSSDNWKIIEVMGFKKRRNILMAAINTLKYRLSHIAILDSFYELNPKNRRYGSEKCEDILYGCILFDEVKVLT